MSVVTFAPNLRTMIVVGSAMMRAPMGTRPITLESRPNLDGSANSGLFAASQDLKTGNVRPGSHIHENTMLTAANSETIRQGHAYDGVFAGACSAPAALGFDMSSPLVCGAGPHAFAQGCPSLRIRLEPSCGARCPAAFLAIERYYRLKIFSALPPMMSALSSSEMSSAFTDSTERAIHS